MEILVESVKEKDNDEIKQLQADILDLQVQLNKLDAALKVMLGLLAVTLPVTGIAAIFAGPFAPLVMVLYRFHVETKTGLL